MFSEGGSKEKTFVAMLSGVYGGVGGMGGSCVGW